MEITNSDLRSEVASFYGSRVRHLLSDELLAVVPATSCCGTAESSAAACCDTGADDGACCGSAASDEQISRVAALYAESDVSDLPATVTDVAFGCGNPGAIAALQPGETVLDLGSGGGIDCFLAAKMVGPAGRVIGVDMTAEMLELAERNRVKVGATNVEFRRGEIEALPVDDHSVDVVISNCVINLSPDKDAVFREAFRVLKPGGRLQVSDMVWRGTAPVPGESSMESWSACVGGAIALDDYLGKVRAAGFSKVEAGGATEGTPSGLASVSVYAERPH